MNLSLPDQLAEIVRAIEPTVLHMWTVYDHPTDHPDHFVARLWFCLPEPTPTSGLLSADDVEALRDAFIQTGYSCLTRSPEDDPKIVEVWL